MPVASQRATTMQPPRSWFRRNWKWFMPGMFAVAIAMAGIAVFSYVQIRSYRFRQNPSYQAALAAVQASEQIQSRLGKPIVDSDWNPQGSIEVRNDATIGEARFNFDVSGPDGNAIVTTNARMVDGEWALTSLDVQFGDDEVIRLKDFLAQQKVDTPEFKAGSDDEPKSLTEKPPKEIIDVNVEVPDVPPGLK
ncbi:MAG: cytochrome c oxidase assembly factor Coa1 family protein [Pirellulales bacterium]